MEASPTEIWWAALCAVAAVNVAAWSVCALRVVRGGHCSGCDELPRWQLALSAVYVAGCAYRSALPVFDVPRLVLVDSAWSSVVVGRSVATVAEVCFAAQWALLLRRAAAAADSRFAGRVAASLVPLIAVAESFSWHAVLTTSNLGHVVEEAIWGSAALLVVAALVRVTRNSPRELRPLLVAWSLGGAVYAGFMFGVDVPMYWARWVADEAIGRSYLTHAQGLADVSTRWIVSRDWNLWKSEVVWMSLYFSVAVWTSIALALAHVPLRARGARPAPAPARATLA